MREMHGNKGTELAQLLLGSFEAMVGRAEFQLGQRGHAGFTAANEFALVAIGSGAGSAAELGRQLGISRQAAAKAIAALEQLGYVARTADPADARRKLVSVTDRGYQAHAVGAELFDSIRDEWVATLGAARMDSLEDSLRAMLASSH